MRSMPRRTDCFQKVITIAFLLALLHPRVVLGQEPDRCREVLQHTNVDRLDTMNKKLTDLNLIETQEDWQRAQSAGAGLKVIFDSIPAAATANYNDFQTWRQATLKETHFDLTDQESHSLEMSFLPPAEIDAWKECMKIRAGGLALAVDDVTASTETIHLYWVKPALAVGTSESAVKITPDASTHGGSLKGTWPRSLKNVTVDDEAKITYTRIRNQALVVTIDAADKNNHHAVATARVLADPQYRKDPCTFNLDGLHGIPHGAKWDFPPCTGLQPGTQATVALTGATFRVDGPHGIWIELADFIDSDTKYNDDSSAPLCIPVHPGDSVRGDNDPHPWNFTHNVTVPWDGIVNVSIWVIRAQIFMGDPSSL